MNEQDWEIIKNLYIYKNITVTADKLFISQPALTKRLRYIEKEIGFEVVTRNRRGVFFTGKGEYLAKCANDMLEKFAEVKERVREMDKKVIGTLRLGVANHLAKHKLPALLKQFKSLYPEVDFEVTTGWSSEIFNLVNNQQVHFAILSGDFSWPNEKLLLFKDPICVASKDKINVKELPYLKRIDYRTEIYLKTIVDDWWKKSFSEPPNISMKVDKADTCKEIVLKGLGYAILPKVILGNNTEIEHIILKDTRNNPIYRDTWMYYSKEFLEMNVVRAFVSFIEQYDFEKLFSN